MAVTVASVLNVILHVSSLNVVVEVDVQPAQLEKLEPAEGLATIAKFVPTEAVSVHVPEVVPAVLVQAIAAPPVIVPVPAPAPATVSIATGAYSIAPISQPSSASTVAVSNGREVPIWSSLMPDVVHEP